MTRLAAIVVLLTLGLVALAWHALRVLDRLLGGDGRLHVELEPWGDC
jgi:hypothetical protein